MYKMNHDKRLEVEKILLENYNVPRGTFLQLENYVELLLKWNKKINLISANSENDVWTRHILDSAQLISHIPATQELVDIGSGSGLPGLVLSILGVKTVNLIDSDMRKCVFLEQAKKFSENTVHVHNCLFEESKIDKIELVTARAFCKLSKLFELVYEKLAIGAELVILKGESWGEEIKEALPRWGFKHEVYPSMSSNSGVILKISEVYRKI